MAIFKLYISDDLDIIWGMLCVIRPHASPSLYACLLTFPLSLCLLALSYLSLSLAFFSTTAYLFVASWFCVISCIYYYTFLGLIMCILSPSELSHCLCNINRFRNTCLCNINRFQNMCYFAVIDRGIVDFRRCNCQVDKLVNK